MSSVQGRKRSKLACQTCRELKRKCDGNSPCGNCLRFEYDCTYQDGRKRKRLEHSSGPVKDEGLGLAHRNAQQSPPEHSSLPSATPAGQARSLEANSGSAFVTKLGLRLDSKRNSKTQTFAWNAFLGCRQAAHVPVVQDITHMISQKRMQTLAAVYFEKVDPIYGFIDRQELYAQIQNRWTAIQQHHQPQHDAMLCGLAALGCLFSQIHTDVVEVNLVETARSLLEQTLIESPSATGISAWLLRIVYLRIAGTHYTAWMASCMVMHMIEAAGLNSDWQIESTLSSPPADVDSELRTRLLSVSQHLNIWMSFDMGLSRVALANTTSALPSPRQGDHTRELMQLLPLSIELDPERRPTAADLEVALNTVLNGVHSSPPSVLAQTNLALCLCRRLRSLEVTLTEPLLQQILLLTSNGIRAARAIFAERAPWHHMAYVPFQIVCVLLAIDTVSSISQLREAVTCLKDISEVYNTDATREALRTARSLILLYQKGKEMFASALTDVLRVCPVESSDEVSEPTPSNTGAMQWIDGVNDEFFGLQYPGVDQFLAPEFFWNAGSNAF